MFFLGAGSGAALTGLVLWYLGIAAVDRIITEMTVRGFFTHRGDLYYVKKRKTML